MPLRRQGDDGDLKIWLVSSCLTLLQRALALEYLSHVEIEASIECNDNAAVNRNDIYHVGITTAPATVRCRYRAQYATCNTRVLFPTSVVPTTISMITLISVVRMIPTPMRAHAKAHLFSHQRSFAVSLACRPPGAQRFVSDPLTLSVTVRTVWKASTIHMHHRNHATAWMSNRRKYQ